MILLLHILNHLIEHPSPRGRTDPLTCMDPAVEWISYRTILEKNSSDYWPVNPHSRLVSATTLADLDQCFEEFCLCQETFLGNELWPSWRSCPGPRGSDRSAPSHRSQKSAPSSQTLIKRLKINCNEEVQPAIDVLQRVVAGPVHRVGTVSCLVRGHLRGSRSALSRR